MARPDYPMIRCPQVMDGLRTGVGGNRRNTTAGYNPGWREDLTGFASAKEWMHADNDVYYEARRELYDLARDRAACLIAQQYPASVREAFDNQEEFFTKKKRWLEAECLPIGDERASRSGKSGKARGNLFRLVTDISGNILSGLIGRLGPNLEDYHGIEEEIMEPGEQLTAAGPWVDRMPGGKADLLTPADFDPRQLAMGQEIEAEHTFDPHLRTEITMDHLAEFDDYYDWLKEMERKAEAAHRVAVGNGDGGAPVSIAAVETFLRTNPNPSDEEFHKWAKSQGYNVHAAEAAAYRIAAEGLRARGRTAAGPSPRDRLRLISEHLSYDQSEPLTILIDRAEGLSRLLDKGLGRAVVHSFDEADAALSHMAMIDPPPEGGSYDKGDIEVIWSDGFVKRYRFDMEYEHRLRVNLLRELENEAKFWLGERCPAHMTEEEYRDTLKRMDPSPKSLAYYRELLKRLKQPPATTSGPRTKRKRVPKGFNTKWEWYADVLQKIGKLENYIAEERGKGKVGDRFRYRAFVQNARRTADLPANYEATVANLEDAGIGEAGIDVIMDLERTGRSARLDGLMSVLDPRVIELLEEPGVGPAKVRAILEGEMPPPKRRGARAGRIALAKAKKVAEELKRKLKSEFQGHMKVFIAGSIRRGAKTVKDVDILILDGDPADVKDFVKDYASKITSSGRKRIDFVYKDVPVNFRIVNENDVTDGDLKAAEGAALLYFTGPAEMNERMRAKAARDGYKLNEYGLWYRGTNERVPRTTTERAIYKALDLPYAEPAKRR